MVKLANMTRSNKKTMMYRHFQGFHVGHHVGHHLDHLADMMADMKLKKPLSAA